MARFVKASFAGVVLIQIAWTQALAANCVLCCPTCPPPGPARSAQSQLRAGCRPGRHARSGQAQQQRRGIQVWCADAEHGNHFHRRHPGHAQNPGDSRRVSMQSKSEGIHLHPRMAHLNPNPNPKTLNPKNGKTRQNQGFMKHVLRGKPRL